MLHNTNTNNNIAGNNISGNKEANYNSMPGSMPGTMPVSIPQDNNNNTQQFEQQGSKGFGGPHKIQSGILNHGLPVDHDSVDNKSLGQNGNENNLKTDADLSGHEINNSQNNYESSNPLNTRDGHRYLDSHHKGLPHNSEHHYGHDAALTGGTAGVTGLAHHEYKEHKNKNAEPLNTSNHEGANPFLQDSSRQFSIPISQGGKDHHYGRVAAGTAGLAHHEYKEHENKKNNKELLNDTQRQGTNPLLHDSRDSTSRNSKDHHYGRDAAIAGGTAGAAGLGLHEYKEHENKRNSASNGSQHDGVNPLDQDSPESVSQDGKDHHYDRDAALAGGARLAHHEDKNKENKVSFASNNSAEGKHTATGADNKKPLNTNGTAHHIAERPLLYEDGGLTGKQPVGEINFKKL